ncbi:MAG: dihydrofolate reductase [Bacteroidales bacterium]|nr:dihydrofolate reductase [Bacteroidales bacterium]
MVHKHFSAIAAVATNWAIGYNNQLLWHIKDDFKLFRETTSGHKVLMGRKTFESFAGKPLPNRQNIIVSGSMKEVPAGCLLFNALEKAVEYLAQQPDEVFILGGATIYQQLMPCTHNLYISHVHASPAGDTYFPIFKETDFDIVEEQKYEQNERNQFAFTFRKYVRKETGTN